MFKYFSIKDNLSDVLLYLKNDSPKIILCEYNCLIDNRMYIREFDDEYLLNVFKDYLKNEFLLEFIIFDNKIEKEKIENGLSNTNMYDLIIEQESVLNSFYETYSSFIDRNRSIWKINLSDTKKNELLNILSQEYQETNIKFVFIFSTLIDAVNYILVHGIEKNIEIIVFDTLTKYSSLKEGILELLGKNDIKNIQSTWL